MVKFLLCRTAKYGNLLKLKLLALAVPLFLLPNILVAQIQSSFVFEGYTRTYLVYLPPSYNDVDSMPVVFNLHGYQLNAEQQMDYSRMNKVADTAGFIVVYPNAVNTAWNCGVSGPPNVNDVGFISVLIDTLADHYSIDKEKIYSCGFSLGGFMSHRLACELSNRIAAIADVGGVMAISLLNNTSTLHSMPVLKIHGTDDQIVPYNGAYDWCSVQQTLNHWTNFNLCNPPDTISMPNLDTLDGCTVQRIRYHFLSDSGDVIFYKVLSGGHSWPSGDTTKFTWHSLGPIGKTNMDINASELIWNFFKNYRLPEPTEVKEYIQTPSEFVLFQNYPNPFNPSTKISWQSPVGSWQRLKVYDVLGNEITTLVDEYRSAGNYEVEFSAKSGSASGGNAYSLVSGIYFYQLKVGEFISTKKMLLIH
jgi:polyhydroxybutyrate depolymerase